MMKMKTMKKIRKNKLGSRTMTLKNNLSTNNKNPMLVNSKKNLFKTTKPKDLSVVVIEEVSEEIEAVIEEVSEETEEEIEEASEEEIEEAAEASEEEVEEEAEEEAEEVEVDSEAETEEEEDDFKSSFFINYFQHYKYIIISFYNIIIYNY